MIGLELIATSIVCFFGFRSMPCKFMNDGFVLVMMKGLSKEILESVVVPQKK